MEFRVLGPVEIHAGGSRLDVGYARQRALLAVLLLELGWVVPADRLIDRVWGEEPPPQVRNGLYGYVAKLRAVIAAAGSPGTSLTRQAGGYMLQAAPNSVDLLEFRRLVTQAGAAGDDEHAADLLRQALALWRGTALTGVASPWLDGVRQGLDQERRAAVLDLYDVELRLGRHAILLSELMEAAAATPADERLAGLLMLALYRCGRPAEALRCFEQTRRRLAEELGADPGHELCHLHEQVLRHDPSLEWRAAAGPGPATVRDGSWVVSRELPVVPRELPADVAAFTGRAGELAELDRLLAGRAEDGEPGTVVVSAVAGTAGVGKSALAVRWAHGAADRFPDGQLYVNLRGYDPGQPVPAADALTGFLSSLGVAGPGIPAELAQRTALYRSLLAGRRVLVVLDNACDVEQVRPLLPGAAGCRVVVTSRDALAGLVARDGAWRLSLDLLPMADAVALLRAVIGGRVDEEPEAAQAIAARCARLPLALRVAAELAVAQPGVPLARLAAELADEQGRLELLNAAGDPRTAVRAVFSWSTSHMEQATVEGFRLLGLHPGPDLEEYAAAAIAGTTLAEARRLLTALARAHLIGPSPAGPGRYAMHDLLRAYARDLAAEHGGQQQAAMTRLLDHYLHTSAIAMDTLYPAERQTRPEAPASGTPVPPVAEADAARGWLEREMACQLTAAGHAATHDWPSHATRLARNLFRHLVISGSFAQAITLHIHALSAARQLGDRAAEAAALIDLGGVEFVLSRFEEATAYLQRALALAREADDRPAQIRALGNLGNAEMARGRYQTAISYVEQVLFLSRQTGDKAGQARGLNSLGAINVLRGRHQEAIGHLRQAVATAREVGDQGAEASALSELGYCETALGSHQQAAGHLRESLALSRQMGYRSQEAYVLGGLGKVQFGRGRHTQAVALLQRAAASFRDLHFTFGEAEMLNHLGQVLLADSQPGQARSQYIAARALADQIGDKYQQARAVDGLASCEHAAGNHDLASHHWREALAIFTSLGSDEAGLIRARLAATGPAGVSALDRPD